MRVLSVAFPIVRVAAEELIHCVLIARQRIRRLKRTGTMQMTGERIDNPMARNDGVFGARDPEHECPECGAPMVMDAGSPLYCTECRPEPDCDEDGEDGDDRDN